MKPRGLPLSPGGHLSLIEAEGHRCPYSYTQMLTVKIPLLSLLQHAKFALKDYIVPRPHCVPVKIGVFASSSADRRAGPGPEG